MYDLTIDETHKGQRVFFYVKPSDKMPTVITKLLNADTDERERSWADLQGIGWVPLYQVRPLTVEQCSFYPEPSDVRAQPIKGIDF